MHEAQAQRIKPSVFPPTSTSSIFSYQINHFRKKKRPAEKESSALSLPAVLITSLLVLRMDGLVSELDITSSTPFPFIHTISPQYDALKCGAWFRAAILRFLKRVFFHATNDVPQCGVESHPRGGWVIWVG